MKGAKIFGDGPKRSQRAGQRGNYSFCEFSVTTHLGKDVLWKSKCLQVILWWSLLSALEEPSPHEVRSLSQKKNIPESLALRRSLAPKVPKSSCSPVVFKATEARKKKHEHAQSDKTYAKIC